MTKLVALLVPIALCAAACAESCPSRNGSVDGYCKGKTAVNCANDCGDCTDYWHESPCQGTCSVEDSPPPYELVGSNPPVLTTPNRFAVCSEWSAPADAGAD